MNTFASSMQSLSSATPASLDIINNLNLNKFPVLHAKSKITRFQLNIRAIEILKDIEASGRSITSSEQIELSNYSGFGGIPEAFADINGKYRNSAWEIRANQLETLLSKEELHSLTFTLSNAFFTPQNIVNTMWSLAAKNGYRGGIVLEPSCGSGSFIGHSPSKLNSRFIGVEYDLITAKIAQLIYPDSTIIHSGIENVPLQSGMFDLVLANPPYSSDLSLNFKFHPEFNNYSIHNQFILSSIDALKEGGLLVVVVSRYFMDSENLKARYAIAEKAKLISGLRLPSCTFEDSTNTSVITDILVFQKLTEQELSTNSNWDYLDNVKWVTSLINDDGVIRNSYFEDNKSILGEYETISSPYGKTLNVKFEGDIGVELNQFIPQDTSLDIHHDNSDTTLQSRYDDLVNHLLIEMSGVEVGTVLRDNNNSLYRIIEKDSDHGFSYFKQYLNENTIWSKRFRYDENKSIYELIPKIEAGKKVYVIEDGKESNRLVYERHYTHVDNIKKASKLGAIRLDKLDRLIDIRDALKAQLNLELSEAKIEEIETNRSKLNGLYEAFVKNHGYINSPSNCSLLNELPDCSLMMSLEINFIKSSKVHNGFTPSGNKRFKTIRKESCDKAAILSKRVLYKTVETLSADSPEDALALSLSNKSFFDLDYVSFLCGMDPITVVKALHDDLENPMIFFDHSTQCWQDREKYLSGNVRKKLSIAQQNKQTKNIQALLSVLPEQINIEDISLTLGMNFIPTHVYSSFVQSISDDPKARVLYEPVSNTFEVHCEPSSIKSLMYACSSISLEKLLNKIMNCSTIRIVKEIVDGKYITRVIDYEATEQANILSEQIKAEFATWIYDQVDLLDSLTELYNERYNSHVTRKYDGSHLKLIGKVPDEVIDIRRHQKNAAWRGVVEDFVLYDHAVGSGKTWTSVCRALERKRLGLSTKPTFIVPNHLVHQFTADVYRLCPSANVLAATNKDFEKSRRKRLFAKIATGDYDFIIIPHSSFEFIKLSPEFEKNIIEKELESVKDQLEAQTKDGRFSSRTLKKLRDMQRRLDNKLKSKISKRRDNLLTFESLGINDLTVDESHIFKNIQYTTNMTNIVGMGNPTGSNRAFDLYLKVRYLQSIKGSCAFLTGTPISNSAVEMFNVMRFLIPDVLAELGLDRFDIWAKMYTDNTSKYEATESGKLKQVTRLARNWKNMRSLMQLWYLCADPITNQQMIRLYEEDNPGKKFPLPQVHGGTRQCISVQPTDEQELLLDEVLQGFKELQNIGEAKERNAERLRLMDKARKLSLAARCVDFDRFKNETGGKLQAVAENVVKYYKQWDQDKGTQVVFLDRSVPVTKSDHRLIKEYDCLKALLETAIANDDDHTISILEDRLALYDANEVESIKSSLTSNWSAYQELKDLMILNGIPAHEIRFIQEAKNDLQKQEIFDQMRSGEIRVLIGSTPRMGPGSNFQNRLIHLHHVDTTFKPSDIEQREGRIIRQGNELYEIYGHDNFYVGITAYVTERTVDAKQWNLCSVKLKMINSIRFYDGSHNLDFGEDADNISMNEIAAIASGNPLMMEKVVLEGECQTLERMKSMFERKKAGTVNQIAKAKRIIEQLPSKVEKLEKTAEILREEYNAIVAERLNRTVLVDGIVITSLKAFEDYIEAKPKGKTSIVINEKQYTSKARALSSIKSIFGNPDKPFEVEFHGRKVTSTIEFSEEIAKQFLTSSRSNDGLHICNMLGHKIILIDKGKVEGSSQRYLGFEMRSLDGTDYINSLFIGSVVISGQLTFNVTSISRCIYELFANTLKYVESSRDYQLMQLKDAEFTLSSAVKYEKLFPKLDELEAKRRRLICVSKLLSEDNCDQDVVDLGSWEGEYKLIMEEKAKALLPIQTYDMDTQNIESNIEIPKKDENHLDTSAIYIHETKTQLSLF